MFQVDGGDGQEKEPARRWTVTDSKDEDILELVEGIETTILIMNCRKDLDEREITTRIRQCGKITKIWKCGCKNSGETHYAVITSSRSTRNYLLSDGCGLRNDIGNDGYRAAPLKTHVAADVDNINILTMEENMVDENTTQENEGPRKESTFNERVDPNQDDEFYLGQDKNMTDENTTQENEGPGKESTYNERVDPNQDDEFYLGQEDHITIKWQKRVHKSKSDKGKEKAIELPELELYDASRWTTEEQMREFSEL